MNDNTPRRTTPTESMLGYARKVAKALGEDLPKDAETDFDTCRNWLDSNAERVPPTQKQVDYAQQLAESAGETIPDDVATSKPKLSKWIDEHVAGA